MPKRAKILVVDSDLNSLSRIYLSLIHKNYKVEASDDALEIIPRIERFKPRLLILSSATKNLSHQLYQMLQQKKIPVIVIQEKGTMVPEGNRRMEELPAPLDLALMDEKVKDILNIVE